MSTVDCQIFLMSMEELRKNSLKRKKTNDSRNHRKFHYQIQLKEKSISQGLETPEHIISPTKSHSNRKSKTNKKTGKNPSESLIRDVDIMQAETEPISKQFKGFPIISDFLHSCVLENGTTINYLYGCTYSGFLFSLRLSK